MVLVNHETGSETGAGAVPSWSIHVSRNKVAMWDNYIHKHSGYPQFDACIDFCVLERLIVLVIYDGEIIFIKRFQFVHWCRNVKNKISLLLQYLSFNSFQFIVIIITIIELQIIF